MSESAKELRYKVSIYVPSTVDVDKALDEKTAEKYVRRTVTFLSNLFGGATAIAGFGGWMEGGHLVTENVTIVYAFAPTLTSRELAVVERYCEALRIDMRQSAVAYAIDTGEVLRFVTAG